LFNSSNRPTSPYWSGFNWNTHHSHSSIFRPCWIQRKSLTAFRACGEGLDVGLVSGAGGVKGGLWTLAGRRVQCHRIRHSHIAMRMRVPSTARVLSASAGFAALSHIRSRMMFFRVVVFSDNTGDHVRFTANIPLTLAWEAKPQNPSALKKLRFAICSADSHISFEAYICR
jgi:hypothetical protein